ncbi:vitellogenin-like [Microplitis mediator]|uniref:vitellogenin-like n=1 Tax=Microplitis mediator TaxID=375433 RepID=UPI00255266AA|nr:vitellogenin-like [Microplitis mediator]XP_057328503.1 vitellogenin-like [Microplitis mediator]
MIVSEPKPQKKSCFGRMFPCCVKKPKENSSRKSSHSKSPHSSRKSSRISISSQLISPEVCGSNRKLSAAEIRSISRHSGSLDSKNSLPKKRPSRDRISERKLSKDRGSSASSNKHSSKRHSRLSGEQRLSSVNDAENSLHSSVSEKTSTIPLADDPGNDLKSPRPSLEKQLNSSAKLSDASVKSSSKQSRKASRETGKQPQSSRRKSSDARKDSKSDSKNSRNSDSSQQSTSSRKKGWSLLRTLGAKTISDDNQQASVEIEGASAAGETGDPKSSEDAKTDRRHPRLSTSSRRSGSSRPSKDIMDQTTVRLSDLSSIERHSDIMDQTTLPLSDPGKKELRSSSRTSADLGQPSTSKLEDKRKSKDSSCSTRCSDSRKKSSDSGTSKKCQRQSIRIEFCTHQKHRRQTEGSLDHPRASIVSQLAVKMTDSLKMFREGPPVSPKKCHCSPAKIPTTDTPSSSAASEIDPNKQKTIKICECEDNPKNISRSKHALCGCTNKRCHEKRQL